MLGSRDGSGSGIGGDGGEEWLLLGVFCDVGIVVVVSLVKTYLRAAVVIRS